MAIPSDEDIRTKIAAAVQLVAPKAIVFPYWVIGFDETKWPGLLRSSEDEGRVHGYVLGRRRSTGARRTVDCVRRNYNYLLLGLHYYKSGTVANNSEKLVSAEADAISDKFDKASLLDPALGQINQNPIEWEFFLRSPAGELLHILRAAVVVPPCYTI